MESYKNICHNHVKEQNNQKEQHIVIISMQLLARGGKEWAQ